MVRASSDTPMVLIQPEHGIAALKLADLWAYRELLYFLAWRDVKIRYKQSILGPAWAIVQPVCTMVVFSIFFGKLGKIPSDGVPYPIFAYVALLPWQLFSQSLNLSSQSVVGGAGLITKVYFPRLIIPLSSVLASLVDFVIAFGILLILMFYYGIVPTWGVLLLPGFILMAIFAALGVGVWLAVINVKYRDVRYALPFFTQFWLFVSPVAYPSSMVPAKWQWLYGLNPMAGVIEGFRWALLGTRPPLVTIYIAVILVAVLFVGGIYYFRSAEKMFADVI
ncbi:MAG: ABC transporter permease [Deltaproteobacteria bacterium]|nr:ABC transporter permease [Deltaproteobacteria bacterium]